MKIRLILWLLALSGAAVVRAEAGSTAMRDAEARPAEYATVPVDSLVFTAEPAACDGIFLSPQPVSFRIRSDTPTDRPVLDLVCTVTTDAFFPVDSLFVAVRPDSSGKIGGFFSFVPPAPGFYRVSVYAADGTAKSRTLKFNVGYDPEKIVSPPDARADFDAFWEKTLAELAGVRPRYRMTLLRDQCTADKKMYRVEMYSWENVKIEGYYCVPRLRGKHPAIIRFQGYAANPRFPDPDALPDFCELILSVRGQGIQKQRNPYGEWIVCGLSDKDTYYYRGAYMDLIRGTDFLTSRPEVDSGKIVAEGGSQGGALTLVACALDRRIRAAAPRLPFLSDFRDYFGICPWPRSLFENYLREHPDRTWENIYDVLSYFDVKNFAGRIGCPIILGIGLQDETCPPHTNFAGYNLIRSEKRYIVYPDRKHSVDDNWWLAREIFFREQLRITPPARR